MCLFIYQLAKPVYSLVMAVLGLVAIEHGPLEPVDGTDEPFQPIAEVGHVRAPVQVARQVSQRHAEPGEHHHRDGQRRAKERSVLRKKRTVD